MIDEQLDLFTGSEWEPEYCEGFSSVEATKYMQNYWSTFSSQHRYENYSYEVWIEDALYGVGAAISDSYRFGEGFAKFKKSLQKRWFKKALEGAPL